MGCGPAVPADCCLKFRDSMMVSSARVEMPHVKSLGVTFRPLKTRPSRCYATSYIDHSLTEPHYQEERIRHLCQCESLNTRKFWFIHQNVRLICGEVQWPLSFGCFKLIHYDFFEKEYATWRLVSCVCVTKPGNMETHKIYNTWWSDETCDVTQMDGFILQLQYCLVLMLYKCLSLTCYSYL